MKENRTVEYPLNGWERIDTLLWDWNGTLLDDVDANVQTINKMLSRRDMKSLSLSEYKNRFCFPVKSFYQQIGFDLEKEPIEEISIEYHSTYKYFEKDVRLNTDVSFVLDRIREKGISQYILSACMKHDLLKLIEHFDLRHHFEAIYGADDICANGKIGIGQFLIEHHSLDPDRTLIIGDTLHDAEVAKSLGINYLLYAGGHNSYELLIKEGKVVDSLRDIF